MKIINKLKTTVLLIAAILTVLPSYNVYAEETLETETHEDNIVKECQFDSHNKFSVRYSDQECKYFNEDTNEWVILTNYMKFEAPCTGYLTVKISKNSTQEQNPFGNITFCNKNKNAIGKSAEYWSTKNVDDSRYYTRTYGIKKGNEYFIKLQSNAGIRINVNAVAVKKGTNTSKANATSLAAKKTAKGVLIAGENDTYWYKIKLKKSKKIRLSYSTKTNGDSTNEGIKITFCKSNGNKFLKKSYDKLSVINSSGWMFFYRENLSVGASTIGIKPGTYYVKVQKMNSKSSGYFTLKYVTY